MDISNFIKIFASERRTEVLDALIKGAGKDEIKGLVPSSTYAFTLDYLKKVGFAEEKGGEILLTESGRGYLVIFRQFKESIDILQHLYESFPDHVIFFPDKFLIRLHELDKFEMIGSEPSDILKPHRIFSDYIKSSHEIHGISPILFPDYPEMISGLAGSIGKISLVVSADVFQIISSYPIKNYENIEIYIADPAPRFAVAVTEKFLSIGFFYKSGSYDFTRDMISTAPTALKFGMDLVDHYRTVSRKMV
jgi:predicted transcriptional regulator